MTVGDQDVTLYHAQPGQGSDGTDGGDYAALVTLVQMPNFIGQAEAIKYTVRIHPGEDAGIDQDTAARIVGSLAMPDCTRTWLITYREAIMHKDLNGDGHVATMGEALAADPDS